MLTGSISLWYESSSSSDRKAQGRVVRSAGKIAGTKLPPVGDLAEQRCLSRATCIARDPTHPCHRLFSLLPSGRRYHNLPSRTGRLRDSFYLTAIRHLNFGKKPRLFNLFARTFLHTHCTIAQSVIALIYLYSLYILYIYTSSSQVRVFILLLFFFYSWCLSYCCGQMHCNFVWKYISPILC